MCSQLKQYFYTFTHIFYYLLTVGHRKVFIITGRGNHSKGGFSTVRNAVIKVLKQARYR